MTKPSVAPHYVRSGRSKALSVGSRMPALAALQCLWFLKGLPHPFSKSLAPGRAHFSPPYSACGTLSLPAGPVPSSYRSWLGRHLFREAPVIAPLTRACEVVFADSWLALGSLTAGPPGVWARACVHFGQGWAPQPTSQSSRVSESRFPPRVQHPHPFLFPVLGSFLLTQTFFLLQFSIPLPAGPCRCPVWFLLPLGAPPSHVGLSFSGRFSVLTGP